MYNTCSPITLANLSHPDLPYEEYLYFDSNKYQENMYFIVIYFSID